MPLATPAQSDVWGEVREKRGRMEGLGGRDKRDEAWDGKTKRGKQARWRKRQTAEGELDLF